MRFHNTPSLRTVAAPQKPELTGKALLYKLEDDYSEYRHAVENRLCPNDPAVRTDFETKIAAARAKAEGRA